MKIQDLQQTIRFLLTGDKGILCMDEGTETCDKRFKCVGLPHTQELQSLYRELIVNTPALNKYISGAILTGETVEQQSSCGRTMTDVLNANGIIPGIKLDEGTVELPGFHGQQITRGLDGLTDRLDHYRSLGARFAKWRAAIPVAENEPLSCAVHANCLLLARYAAKCQQAGLVPIVQSEILMAGYHTVYASERVTRRTLNILFQELARQDVDLSALILTLNMVSPGLNSDNQVDLATIAELTVLCLLETVPASVPGIAFLSGGQSPELATSRLNLINRLYMHSIPWKLTYSFSSAFQQPLLEYWAANSQNVVGAQRKLFERAKLNSFANRGYYKPQMEKNPYKDG